MLDNDPGAAADPAAFERAVSKRPACASSWRAAGFSVGLAVRGGEVRPASAAPRPSASCARWPSSRPTPDRCRRSAPGTVVRIRPGAAPALEAARARRQRDREDAARMRFASAHKMVTYLLVLAALAAVASTARARADERARCSLVAAALSFHVESGNRVALALDRAVAVVRVAASRCSPRSRWRLWRRLPDPDVCPAFDLVLALLGYKLFFRRIHRDYIHIAALTFLLVLVASTIAHSFVFVATFAIYVVVAVWALILFHLRREMEENYLIKHSAQAPSQKVGVGRILGSRRVVGGTFFVATAGMAVAVFVGAVTIFMLVPRVGAGFAVGVTRMSGSAAGFADEIAIGRYGTRAAHRREVVLRATLPDLLARDETMRATRPRTSCIFAAPLTTVTRAGAGSTATSPSCARSSSRTAGGSGSARTAPRWKARSLPGRVRQEIEAIGIPASVLIAIDRPRAFELPATKLGAAGSLRVFPRWSGEAALRVGGGDGDTFITLSHAHYVAYSRARAAARARSRRAWRRARGPLTSRCPRISRAALANLAATLGEPDLAGSDTIAAVTRALRAKHGYTLEPQPAPAGVDPVESFLLGERAGHCELFASAAVLLLRRARRSRPLRDRLPGRRMEHRRRLRRRPRRPRARVGGGVPPGSRLGARRRDAARGAAAARRPRVRSDGRARLLLEPLGRRLRPGAAAGARAPRGPPPRAARRARAARASSRWRAGACAAGGALLLAAPSLAPPSRALRARRSRR